MTGRRPKEEVSYYMSRIRSKGTKLEAKLEEILKSIGVKFVKYPKIVGTPDFAYPELKIAIFADSDFWHGYNWEEKKHNIKTNREFWIQKIERNIERDKEVTHQLKQRGWRVVRLWGNAIHRQPDKCRAVIVEVLNQARKSIDAEP